MKSFKAYLKEDASIQHPMIDVDGVQKHRNNSEGQPIHPTDEGIKNFHRWFGDSDATDHHGRPKVYYHGSGADIDQFKEKKMGNVKNHILDIGIHFASSPKFASEYAERSGGITRDEHGNYNKELMPPAQMKQHMKYHGSDSAQGAGNVSKVYLKTKTLDSFSKLPHPVANSLLDETDKHFKTRNRKSVKLLDRFPIDIMQETQRKSGGAALQGILKKHGYSAAKYDMHGDTRVVFHPHQVKSATGNNGNFSGDSEKINESYIYE